MLIFFLKKTLIILCEIENLNNINLLLVLTFLMFLLFYDIFIKPQIFKRSLKILKIRSSGFDHKMIMFKIRSPEILLLRAAKSEDEQNAIRLRICKELETTPEEYKAWEIDWLKLDKSERVRLMEEAYDSTSLWERLEMIYGSLCKNNSSITSWQFWWDGRYEISSIILLIFMVLVFIYLLCLFLGWIDKDK